MIGQPAYNFKTWRGLAGQQAPRYWRQPPKRGKRKPAARGRRK